MSVPFHIEEASVEWIYITVSGFEQAKILLTKSYPDKLPWSFRQLFTALHIFHFKNRDYYSSLFQFYNRHNQYYASCSAHMSSLIESRG